MERRHSMATTVDERVAVLFVLTISRTPRSLLHKQRDDAPEQEDEEDREHDEAIARHALLVAQRTQALDAAGGKVMHQLGVRSGRSAKMGLHPLPGGGHVVFA